MEITKRVNTYQTDLYCDKCGGKMRRSSSVVLMTYPPRYQYTCDKCGMNTTATVDYPVISYEEVEE